MRTSRNCWINFVLVYQSDVISLEIVRLIDEFWQIKKGYEAIVYNYGELESGNID